MFINDFCPIDLLLRRSTSHTLHMEHKVELTKRTHSPQHSWQRGLTRHKTFDWLKSDEPENPIPADLSQFPSAQSTSASAAASAPSAIGTMQRPIEQSITFAITFAVIYWCRYPMFDIEMDVNQSYDTIVIGTAIITRDCKFLFQFQAAYCEIIIFFS